MRELFLRQRDFLVYLPMKLGLDLPADCRKCPLGAKCWGCRSRAYTAGRGMHGKDPRCFRGVARRESERA